MPQAPAPTLVSVVQTWLPILTQGGFAVVSIVLCFVARAMWNRIVLLEKDKETILKQSIEDARKEAEASQDLLREVVEEQTKGRRVMERLERKLAREETP